MCGIFGYALHPGRQVDRATARRLLECLFRFSETRGREAAGVAYLTRDDVRIHKEAVKASTMLRSTAYTTVLSEVLDRAYGPAECNAEPFALIGHSRLVTNGLQGIDANNQPLAHSPVVLVHNGIVVNVRELVTAYGLPKPRSEVDSEVIALLVTRFLEDGASLDTALVHTMAALEGEVSIAMLLADRNQLVLATNTGSLYLAGLPGGFIFASEQYILERSLASADSLAGGTAGSMRIRPGEICILDLVSGVQACHGFTYGTPNGTPNGTTDATANGASSVAPLLGTARRIEDRADYYARLREQLSRCSRCLLPETMPFIAFDAAGVCNYCTHHRPLSRKSRAELEALLAGYRRDDGRPDCIVAFSGGRDSSYGLHLLKQELGMDPVAFTYDWGMVTDIARRNQARMCGRLGIEHLWISADIKGKRANIRRNLEAWLHRPRLGMVPLLMAGDKQFFRLSNNTMENLDIRLMVWCMNNLERTDFKVGFAGVPPVWDESRHYNLSRLRAARIAGYYGSQYLLNPRYINRSLLDSLEAFVSYYFVSQDHVFLYDYMDWDEEALNATLIGEYDWETAVDTPNTWRIGDGTAPFYNYVYCTVAGFSEHDTFRSNQIREGIISREQGLELVRRDNVPRWSSIREYLQILNVDFDEVIRTIERIPKLYEPPR